MGRRLIRLLPTLLLSACGAISGALATPQSPTDAATPVPTRRSDVEVAWDRSISDGQFPNCSIRGTLPGQAFLLRVTNRGIGGGLLAQDRNFKAVGTDGISYLGGPFIDTIGGVDGLSIRLNLGETGRGWVCFKIPRGVGISRFIFEETLTGRTTALDVRWP